MLLLSMFYWNMNDSRDLDNFDHPSSFLTNSAFLLEFVFRLAFGSNLPKRMKFGKWFQSIPGVNFSHFHWHNFLRLAGNRGLSIRS